MCAILKRCLLVRRSRSYGAGPAEPVLLRSRRDDIAGATQDEVAVLRERPGRGPLEGGGERRLQRARGAVTIIRVMAIRPTSIAPPSSLYEPLYLLQLVVPLTVPSAPKTMVGGGEAASGGVPATLMTVQDVPGSVGLAGAELHAVARVVPVVRAIIVKSRASGLSSRGCHPDRSTHQEDTTPDDARHVVTLVRHCPT